MGDRAVIYGVVAGLVGALVFALVWAWRASAAAEMWQATAEQAAASRDIAETDRNAWRDKHDHQRKMTHDALNQGIRLAKEADSLKKQLDAAERRIAAGRRGAN